MTTAIKKLTHFEIKPNEGFGELHFGDNMDNFVSQYGEPEDVDSFDEDEELNTTVLHYWERGFSVFFVGLANQVLAGIETDHPEATLFGQKILGMKESDFVAFMEKNGHNEYEAELDKKDKRLSYDVSMMDFFFREDHLVYMNFGVLVDRNGNIEAV